MNKVKIYANDLLSTDGGGNTYLNSFLQYFENSLNYKVIFHIRKDSRNKYRSMLLTILRIFTDLRYDVILFKSNYIPAISLNRRTILVVDFPFQTELSIIDRLKLNRIQHIICNSDYTASHIKKYWFRTAQVLYPPSNNLPYFPGKKKKMILNVGRFTDSNRSKRQDILIDVFIYLYNNGFTDYSLILVGYVQDSKYFEALKSKADGFPIQFYQNCDNRELIDLYTKATFYWHACGYGADLISHPSLTEHYGIAVADAMSAGCITMVHDSGGPAELVKNNEFGLTWQTKEELAQKTMALLSDFRIAKLFAMKAKKRSILFDSEIFNNQLKEIILGK